MLQASVSLVSNRMQYCKHSVCLCRVNSLCFKLSSCLRSLVRFISFPIRRQDLSSAKPTVAVDLANLRHAAAAAQGLHTEDSARTARTEHTDTLADTAAETEGAGTEDTFSTTTVYPEAGDR